MFLTPYRIDSPYVNQPGVKLTSMFPQQGPSSAPEKDEAPVPNRSELAQIEPKSSKEKEVQDIPEIMKQVQDLCDQAKEILGSSHLKQKKHILKGVKKMIRASIETSNCITNPLHRPNFKQRGRPTARTHGVAKACFFCGKMDKSQNRKVSGTGKVSYLACNPCGLKYKRDPKRADEAIEQKLKEIENLRLASSPSAI